jgi:iron complex outermembrane receptor protein
VGDQPIYDGATPNPEDPRRVVLDTGGVNDDESIGGNLDLNWRSSGLFGDTTLRVIGSYVQHDESAFSDQDYSDLLIATLDQNEFNREYVAELNWSSDGDASFGWLLGAFFLRAEGTNSIVAPSKLPLSFLPEPVDVGVEQFFEREDHSAAGFVNAWWQITDPLQIEAGFRYSHDWKTSNAMHPESVLNIGGITIPLFSAIDDSRSGDWGRPSGSLSVDYEFDDGIMTYLRFATGYKSGHLNNDIARLTAPPVSPTDADPEDIYSLEWGSKNRIFDNRLVANLTVFAYWYQDLQVSQLLEAQNFIQNAASARSYGVEVELVYQPWDQLTLTAQFAYLNAKFTDYDRCIDAKDFTIQDCTGNVLTRAPPLSGTFIAAYDLDLARYGTLTPFFQIYASDEIFFRPTNEPDDRQGAYAYLNFRLAWKSARGHLGLEAFVENALDEDVATTKIVGSQLLGAPLLNAYDRPRTFGGRVSLKW